MNHKKNFEIVKKQSQKIIPLVLIICVVLSLTTLVYADLKFSDTPKNAWYYDTVEALCTMNIVSGYPDGTFGPNKLVTKSQLLKLIAMTIDSKIDISKNANYWFESYVTHLNRWDVLTDEEAKSATNKEYESPVTREEAAYYLEKAMNVAKDEEAIMIDTVYEDEEILDKIKDYDQINEKYQKSVYSLVYRKIISGYEDGTFRPKSTLTRAETCALIFRLKKIRFLDMKAGSITVET